MTLRDHIAALVSAAPTGTMVPVESLAEWLALDGATEPARQGTTPVDVDLTVADVMQRFQRGASTVRTWCERGALPGAYRLHGREWRIPVSAIAAMQATSAKRKQQSVKQHTEATSDIGAWRNHVPRAS